jgi:hypothetical protein
MMRGPCAVINGVVNAKMTTRTQRSLAQYSIVIEMRQLRMTTRRIKYRNRLRPVRAAPTLEPINYLSSLLHKMRTRFSF